MAADERVNVETRSGGGDRERSGQVGSRSNFPLYLNPAPHSFFDNQSHQRYSFFDMSARRWAEHPLLTAEH